MLAMDGELGEPRRSYVEGHLRQCGECRARRGEWEAAILEYMKWQRVEAQAARPSAEAVAMARLRTALEAEGAAERRWIPPMRASIATAGLVLLLPLGFVVWTQLWMAHPPGPLPDARLTPGAVRFLSQEQVCSVPPEDEGRLVPPDLARQVFARYRMADPQPRTYEVDYLISPALGGTTSIQNLWPVPYSSGVWTSRVKDALEDRLRRLVCTGQLDAATAQREIALDWIAAYRKYFRTNAPVAEHALFTKDSPWE